MLFLTFSQHNRCSLCRNSAALRTAGLWSVHCTTALQYRENCTAEAVRDEMNLLIPYNCVGCLPAQSSSHCTAPWTIQYSFIVVLLTLFFVNFLGRINYFFFCQDRYRLLTVISISGLYYILCTEKVVLKRTMRDFSCELNYCWDIKITQQRWLGDLKWSLGKTTKSVKNSEKFPFFFI